MSDPQAALKSFPKNHDFLVGIDSDGCAFDSMEIKHKECFIPNIIKFWDMQPVSKYAREAAEFVNLYSKWRGVNRFPGLVMVFDLLLDWPEPMRRGPKLPDIKPLRDWVAAEKSLANPALEKAVSETKDPLLARALEWSKAVNASVEDIVHGVPPFPFVRESLEKLKAQADVLVVSATPSEALVREWAEHDIDRYPAVIAGQEQGKKKEHLALASSGRYAPDKMLMIGDALGDFEAARAVGALFYPIRPGSEDECWRVLHDESLDRFFAGTYKGEYEAGLIAEFEAILPDTPRWKRHS